MAGVVFNELSGKNDVIFGKYIAPIRAVITDEINRGDNEENLLTALYNVEGSTRYAETIASQTGLSSFSAKAEGGIAVNDEILTGYPKIIEHIEFAKEFAITRKMADDSQYGMSADMKRVIKAFSNSYLDTKLELAAAALANGTNGTMTFNGASVDLTTGDGQPLFSKTHKSKAGKADQSNLFATAFSADNLNALAVYFRNLKDDNGKVLGYTPDVIIIPGNRASLEKSVKTVIGSEREAGGNNNDVNVQYGKWQIVVNPFWQASSDNFILMSKKANERLYGNMFFNRVNLDVLSEVDRKTRNLVFNGYCRFGVGFGNWKHALLAGATGGSTL